MSTNRVAVRICEAPCICTKKLSGRGCSLREGARTRFATTRAEPTATRKRIMKKTKKKAKKRRSSRSKPGVMQTVAKERIDTLFEQAEAIVKKNPKRANRYVELARKIAMKAKVKIPSRLKRKFCKHCYSFLLPGFNCRVRNNKGMMVYYCLGCKKFNKVGIKAKKKLK